MHGGMEGGLERRSRRVRVRAHPGPRDRTVAMVTLPSEYIGLRPQDR